MTDRRFGRSMRSLSLAISAAALVAGLIGCFESKYPLSPRSAAPPLDARLLGDWTLEQLNEHGQVDLSKLLVLNLRGEEYYIEWMTSDDDRFRCTAWLTDVNGVTFANLLPLSEDADVPDEYTILRVDLNGEKLKIQHLSSDFFKGKKYDSPDSLRQIVAQNLENNAMYEGEPMYGSRQ